MPSMLTKREERRIKAKIRLLEYAHDPRGFNEIVEFANDEKIYSRVKVKQILDELVHNNTIELRKGERGSKDQYVTTELGKLEVERARQLLAGRITSAIPIAPMVLSLTFNTNDIPPGLTSEAIFRSQKEVLQDPAKSKELGTLIGSIVISYVQQVMTDAPITKGAFTGDGKFTLITVFPREESVRFREMASSGVLQKGNEVPHLSYLLYALGTRALLEIYKSMERGNFKRRTVAVTHLGLRINEEGFFEGHLAEFDTLKIMKQMKKEIETQIRVRSLQQESH
jgi:predicted transcriptional regulator